MAHVNVNNAVQFDIIDERIQFECVSFDIIRQDEQFQDCFSWSSRDQIPIT